MIRRILFTLFIFSIMVVSTACVSRRTSPEPSANMPNPASVHCEQQGGKLELQQDETGTSTGMCVFPDGSKCEEWAFFRGECNPGQTGQPAGEGTPNMPNPASVHCEQQGGKLEMRTDSTGGQAGICVFPDGSECDEWAYFRGECQPADSSASDASSSAPEVASDGCLVYRNDQPGYSFHYPADASVSSEGNPKDAVTITGPLVDDEHWPVIFFNHPSGREEFQPPEDADLAQWLADHNLLAGEKQADTLISGVPAVHLQLARGEQSFASDRYYFIHTGQLYEIVLLHTGDRQDWDLYNHILDSITFEQDL